MAAITFTVNCPGCKGRTNVASRKPTPGGRSCAYFTCSICGSSLESKLRNVMVDGVGEQVEVKTRVKAMSKALLALLAEEAQDKAGEQPTEEAPVEQAKE